MWKQFILLNVSSILSVCSLCPCTGVRLTEETETDTGYLPPLFATYSFPVLKIYFTFVYECLTTLICMYMRSMCVLCTAFHRTVVTGSFEVSWRISERGITDHNSWALTPGSHFTPWDKSSLWTSIQLMIWLHWLPSKPLSLPVSTLTNYHSAVCLLIGHLGYTISFYYRHLVFFSLCFISKFILCASSYVFWLVSTWLYWWSDAELQRKNKGNLNNKNILKFVNKKTILFFICFLKCF